MPNKLKLPSKEQIRSARLAVGLTALEAATMVHRSRRNWFQWEKDERKIDLACWELFLLKTGQMALGDTPGIGPTNAHQDRPAKEDGQDARELERIDSVGG